MESSVDAALNSGKSLVSSSLVEVSKASSDEYALIQRRFIFAALIVSAFAVSITAFFFDFHTTSSLLVGALAGVLYLWLLARNVGKLGKDSKNLSKTQLLVPVVLVLAVSRLPQLDFLPAILGFLLYKPAIVFQVLFEF